MSTVVEVDAPTTGDVQVKPLQPTIGAEITGVDLRYPLSEAERAAIKRAVLDYKVVFFRDQDLNQDQHAAFAAQFGPLYTHPHVKKAYEEKVSAIHRISAADEKDYVRSAAFREEQQWEPYHTDTSWRLVPAWAAVLRAVTLPEVGGDTVWVDAGLAYDNLPDTVKERLEGLHVTHDYRPALNAAGLDYPIVAHPVVRRHRETGRQILWVNFTQRPWLIGLDRAESQELLSYAHDQYRKPENQVRFSWRPGSIAFWDNRAAVHYAVRNYGDFPRLLERILIADEQLWAEL